MNKILSLALGFSIGVALAIATNGCSWYGRARAIDPSKVSSLAKANEWVTYTEMWRKGKVVRLSINLSNGDSSTTYENDAALDMLKVK